MVNYDGNALGYFVRKPSTLLLAAIILSTIFSFESAINQQIINAQPTTQLAGSDSDNQDFVDLNYLALNLEEFRGAQIATDGIVKLYASIFMFENFWLQSKENSSARIPVVARFTGLPTPPEGTLVKVLGTIEYSNLEGGFFYLNASSIEEVKNVILIGWDGVQRNHLYELMNRQLLPNLMTLINNGAIVNVTVTDHRTDSKSGWTQIMTGYRWWKTGVYSNVYWFNSIKAGYTIPERVESHFGKNNVATAHITGKVGNMEVQSGTGTTNTGSFTNEAIFSNVPSQVDVCDVGDRNADAVGPLALQFLENNSKSHFFAFFHFNDPDSAGHNQAYGENSALYEEAIVQCDYWLGQIISKLNALNITRNTLLYLTADHGFDESDYSHSNAPFVAFATNDQRVNRNGNQIDVAPTIYYGLGMWDYNFDPKLDGYPLQLTLPQGVEQERQDVLADVTQPSKPIIAFPTNEAKLFGNIDIKFNASDKHLSAVLLLIDNTLKADNPWMWQGNDPIEAQGLYNWNASSIAPGSHVIAILAFDEHGATNWPSISTIKVNIAVPETPTITPPPGSSPEKSQDFLGLSLPMGCSIVIVVAVATAAITGYVNSKRKK